MTRSGQVLVRGLSPADAAAVRAIYADTAFFGAPVERYFDDRRLFADSGIEAYLRRFPRFVRVADARPGIVGYALGSPTGDAGARSAGARLMPWIAGGLLTGRYRIGRRTASYLSRLLVAAVRGELLEVGSEEYPANLHINLAEAYRGRGVGSALLGSYLQGLREAQLPGVHLVTTSENEAALRLYHRFGFRELSRKRSSLWRPYLGHDVWLIALGLRL